jgi:hypothetical protein
LFFSTNISLNNNGYIYNSIAQGRGPQRRDPLSHLLINLAYWTFLPHHTTLANDQWNRRPEETVPGQARSLCRWLLGHGLFIRGVGGTRQGSSIIRLHLQRKINLN